MYKAEAGASAESSIELFLRGPAPKVVECNVPAQELLIEPIRRMSLLLPCRNDEKGDCYGRCKCTGSIRGSVSTSVAAVIADTEEIDITSDPEDELIYQSIAGARAEELLYDPSSLRNMENKLHDPTGTNVNATSCRNGLNGLCYGSCKCASMPTIANARMSSQYESLFQIIVIVIIITIIIIFLFL